MTLDELALGWREALLGVVALLVLYVGFVVLRLRRLRSMPPADAPGIAAAAAPSSDDERALADDAVAESVSQKAGQPKFPWNEPPDAPSGLERLAAIEEEMNRLRSDLATVHGELASLNGDMDSLRADFRRELERVSEHVQASGHVAPIYGDAMQMALAGHDAASIAECCGVARAEAELVVALIRNRDESLSDGDHPSAMRER